MTYDQSTRQSRRAAPLAGNGAVSSARTGPVTYLAFALSLGFTGAVVLGLLV